MNRFTKYSRHIKRIETVSVTLKDIARDAKDDKVGYTQSFMILQERKDGLPEIIRRPAERLLFADEEWELEGEFTIPCLLTCSGVLMPDGRLLMGYGAADKKVGIAEVNFKELLNYLS